MALGPNEASGLAESTDDAARHVVLTVKVTNHRHRPIRVGPLALWGRRHPA